MSTPQTDTHAPHWLEALGLLHIFRILKLSLQPSKIGLALITIICTFLFGSALDIIWTAGSGVDAAAIDRFIIANEIDQPYEKLTGDYGIFEAWREHGERCVFGLMGSSVPGAEVAQGTPLGAYLETYSRTKPLRNLTNFAYGIWWLISQHPFFFVFFGAGTLLLWGLGGGAICRLAAVEFARDEKFTFMQGLTYARTHLLGGFALAPCIPLVFALLVALLLMASGLLLRIPLLGDLLGGVTFVLSILGGFIIAALLFGLLVGGHFMWPAVAAEGQDAYDAFSRGLSYAFTRPWKTFIYSITATIFASVCWLFVNWFTFAALSITRLFVGAGANWFGLWPRSGGEGDPIGKLQALWSMNGPSHLYTWPVWSSLSWHEYISAFLVGICVLLVVGLMFSFLASFYYCACTTLYFLLRREIDKVDLAEVYMEPYVANNESTARSPMIPLVVPTPPSTDISLPISGDQKPGL